MNKKIYIIIASILVVIIIATGAIIALIYSQKLSEEYCLKAGTKEKLSFSKAKKIAEESECTDEGGLTEDYYCNEESGAWWIGLDIQKEGCSPACVIDVETKQAEINYRCTELISPEKTPWVYEPVIEEPALGEPMP